MRFWVEMTRRGIQAYSECRADGANIYLGSAVEIAMLRLICSKNQHFHTHHLQRPLEVLIEHFISQCDFDEGVLLLNQISRDIEEANLSDQNSITNIISALFEKLEHSEKEYFCSDSHSVASKKPTVQTANVH